MTRDEIIELAKQAGMIQDGEVWFSHSYTNCDVYTVELLFFAKLVAEKEREACALVADEWSGHFQANAIAQAIRARGSV
jgi:hypothetical protein